MRNLTPEQIGLDYQALLELLGKERAVLTGHADRLVKVQFTPDGIGLITISRDGAIKRWRTEKSI